jgi:pSer/pThr/pTyr-binding forkhead associated (FHA) protein
MPKLITRDGSQLTVQGDEVSVGRRDAGEVSSPDVDLSGLERGRTVSRRHARLFRERSTWHLRAEQGTTNTTKVAGRALRPGEESLLSDGDEIELGAVLLTFRADADLDVTMVGRAQAAAELRVDTLVFPLAAPEGRRLWIGRRSADVESTPDIDLSDVPGSRSVSHLHAQLYRSPAGWMLHEGKTTNPTLVAGAQLQPGEDVQLSDGVSLQFGRLRVTFHENRPVRVVTSDILMLEVDAQDVSVEAGRQQTVGLRVVNATGRVEQVEVEIAGIPADWYQILQPDGTRGQTLKIQLFPSGPDLSDPVPNSFARTTIVFAPPKSAASRAGVYPITVSATTQGEERVRRVVATRLRVLPFEGMELTLTPTEAKGASGKYVAEITNNSNADADVVLIFEEVDAQLVCTVNPPQLQLVNGATQQASIKARVRHHNWLGPKRTYGFHLVAASGAQRSIGRAVLVTKPIIPVWLQEILGRLTAMLSPIAIPAFTLVLLLGLAYFFLRPPTIREYVISPSAIAAGTEAELGWTTDRATRVTVEPPIEGAFEVPKGSIKVSPQITTEYTLTAHNWIGISSSEKRTLSVMKILAFKATPERLTKEKEDVVLHWETQGATGVTIEPGAEIKDPKPSGDATVHPTAETTYTLTANGPGGAKAQSQVTVGIGLPAIKRLEVTQPPPGARVFPGDAVQLSWVGEGFTRATITSSKGDVVPGKAELDVSTGSPTTVRPAVAGDVDYTLNLFNAAGSQQATTRIAVTPISITQFETDPANISAGQPSKLRWRIDGANDTTVVTIDPNIGRVEPVGERAVSPTETSEYVLKVQGAGGAQVERRSSITVKAPLPVVSIFTSPRPVVTIGDEVRLTWSVQNADSVEIRTGDNFLIVRTTQLEGSVQDFPAAPTTYILQAIGESGKVTKDFSVDVKPPGAPTPPPATPAPAPAVAPAASPAPAGP